MISHNAGKDIAGKVFVAEFEKDFLLANIEKLCTMQNLENDRLIVDFCMFRNIDSNVVEDSSGITVKEDNFPEIILTVGVNLKDKTTEILFKAETLH